MEELISKFKTLKTGNIEIERLNDNYSKLLNFTYNSEDFMLFMKKIDKINKYYIQNIELINNHDLASIRELIQLIKELLISSINCNSESEKLDYILTAYSNIQFIIKNMNME